MKTFNVNILTTIQILYYSKMILSLICGFTLLSFWKRKEESDNLVIMVLAVIVFAGLFFGLYSVTLLKKIIIPRSKYPLVLNLLCNIKGLGKPAYYGSLTFDLHSIILDNNLRLTLYYINNPQYPVLNFNANKITYYTQEYDWNNFKWNYKTIPQGRGEKQILEFHGINQNNTKITDTIEFGKN